jgi:hypothetical protein
MVFSVDSCDNRPVTDRLLHKEQLALTSQLLRQLRKCLNINAEEPDAERHLVNLTMLLSLAHRKVLPKRLQGTDAGEWICKLSPAARLDETNFAEFCTAGLPTSLPISKIPSIEKFQPLFADPCLAGWTHQLANHKPRWKRIGTSDDNSDPQSASASSLNVQDVPALTQWFTPGWIARFLVEETVPQHPADDFRWLDPACGAGHLIVEAMRALPAPRIALKVVHGWDVDPRMIELAKFAIYLTARETSWDELPLPNLDCRDSLVTRTSSGLKFDGVATNPPYLSHRLMPEELKKFVRKEYKGGHFDLYACFLKLGTALTKPGGTMAMICQQSFLSIQRYERLREELFQDVELVALAQLGAGSFGNMTGEKVNNAIFVVRRKVHSGEPTRLPGIGAAVLQGKYWQLLDEASREQAEKMGLVNVESRSFDPTEVATTSAVPFAFLCPKSILELFDNFPPLQDPISEIEVTNGLFTCNNNLFVRDHRDVPKDSQDDWVPYDKGGGHKWFRTTPYMVHWEGNGQSIRDYRVRQGQSASLPGERFYRKPGVTYSYIGTQSFRARLLSPNSIFDIASSALFSDRWDSNYLVGWLNSALIRFLLGVLNPTVNFQIGDIRRLPFAIPDEQTLSTICSASRIAIESAQQLERLDPESPRFDRFPVSESILGELNEHEFESQRQIDQAIFKLYKVSDSAQATIYADPWVSRGQRPLCDVHAVISKLRRSNVAAPEEQLK